MCLEFSKVQPQELESLYDLYSFQVRNKYIVGFFPKDLLIERFCILGLAKKIRIVEKKIKKSTKNIIFDHLFIAKILGH